MVDLIRRKHEFDVLANKIQQLQQELIIVGNNVLYYKELLKKTRSQMIVIKNLVNAKTKVPDTETVDEAWERNIQAIITKLRSENVT